MGSGSQSTVGPAPALALAPDQPVPALERELELAAIERLLDDIRRGTGRTALILGPAGIGKTTLAQLAGERAREAGLRVLQARGDELEREMSFGLARQLLAGAARQLLAGAARSATASERRSALHRPSLAARRL